MKLTEIKKGIYLVKFKTRYEAASTFLRIQEFYESAFRGIRGKIFTIEEYAELYKRKFGAFTYYKDWGGFNIPSNVFIDFYKTYAVMEGLVGCQLSSKERDLLKLFSRVSHKKEKFYVIGVHKDIDIKHEIAHGYWYLDKEYKKEMRELLKLKGYNRIRTKLLKMGYRRGVLNDEIQAYMGTELLSELYEVFGINCVPMRKVLMFRKVFNKYYKGD